VIATFAPGTQPPYNNAPPLPPYTIVPSLWPDLQKTPDTNSPEVQAWLKELDGHPIPEIPPNPSTDCGAPVNAQALAEAGSNGRCWWTCGGCLRDTDISTCTDQWTYGHGYDDGPGFYTNKLLTYLNAQNIKATFFVVGARVISRPEIVVYEYMTGHELSVHTWSHPSLTTLTNEQIVAELGWTRKAIKDVTGVTPLTFRPPFGDIDDRVRAIALAMGMRPVIWTSIPGPDGPGDPIQWDSNDWRVHQGDVTSVNATNNIEKVLDSSGQFPHGVMVLQHDIYVESVNLAIGYTLPFALNHNPPFKLEPATICQNRPFEDAFLETTTDHGNPAYSAAVTRIQSTPSSEALEGLALATLPMWNGLVLLVAGMLGMAIVVL